jgi:hypothetical protein
MFGQQKKSITGGDLARATHPRTTHVRIQNTTAVHGSACYAGLGTADIAAALTARIHVHRVDSPAPSRRRCIDCAVSPRR